MVKKKCKTNNFFFLLITPLLLAFIVLVIIPLVTFSSDIFSNEKNIKSFSKYLNSNASVVLDNLDSIDTEDKLIANFRDSTSLMNVIILKDDQPIYHSLEIINGPTGTIKSEVTLSNGGEYEIYSSFPLVTKTTLFVGLIMRYILLLVCVVSFYSINKMRKHLKKLERDTENIASGDYDTPIVSKKKDSFVFLDNSLENMRIQIREDRHQLSRFFAGVSHDLKTPLSSIIGYTEALQDGMAKDKEAEELYLNIIHDKSLLLVERISSLISYIKISDQGFKTSLQEKKLYPFLEDFSKKTNVELNLKDIVFDYSLDINKEFATKFDEVLVNRALENLIENAIKYGDISKPIKFKVMQNYDGITMSLINANKSSITKESIEHIFEPFYRGDNSRKGNGFGIGLATVKSIIASHGWKIGMDLNEVDNTLNFSIIIPTY
jgi:signal transduction histidine kinase